MNIRIMALLCAVIVLLSLLCGCDAAETEPDATQPPAIQATEAPTTEPTTEPTTMPTEPPAPPTLLEEQGYVLWDEVEKITHFDTWSYQDTNMPITGRLAGRYEDIMMQFCIVGSDGKEYRDMVPTVVDIQIAELPGSSFDDGILWLEESLTPFLEAQNKRDGSKLTYEEWTAAKADQKLIYTKVAYTIDGTDLYLNTINSGIKMKDLKVGHSYPDLVDANTGSVFCIRTKYNPNEPEVGCWKMDPETGEEEIQSWFTRNYSWNVKEEVQAKINVTFEYFVLVPADYEGITFCMQEFATAKNVDRLILGDTGKSCWGVGSIFDEAFVNCEDYKFHFFGMKVTE